MPCSSLLCWSLLTCLTCNMSNYTARCPVCVHEQATWQNHGSGSALQNNLKCYLQVKIKNNSNLLLWHYSNKTHQNFQHDFYLLYLFFVGHNQLNFLAKLILIPKSCRQSPYRCSAWLMGLMATNCKLPTSKSDWGLDLFGYFSHLVDVWPTQANHPFFQMSGLDMKFSN